MPRRASHGSAVAALATLTAVLAGCGQETAPPAAPTPLYRFQLLTNSTSPETWPAFSPDGTRLAYGRDGGIWVLDLRSFTTARVAATGEHPTWAADGTALYFVRRDVGGGVLHRLVRLELAGGAVVVASPDTVDVYEPAASPSGGAIAYRALSRIDTRQWLRAVDPGGGAPVTLTPPGAWVDVTPAFSRDGERLAFVRLTADGGSRLWAGPAHDPDALAELPGATAGAADPAFTADGARIVFSREGALVATPAAGGAVQPLVAGRGFALSPAASPDGTRLVFASDRTGNFELWMLTDPAGIGPGPYLF